ncbi:hypothetical protein [Pseudomonas lundensis]|uniref:hypothetical protein n=1 Tax=Pseudomonas lundensis TaxID=86185 RepID=UPI0018686785|nr:hypothetical protein [Pseudomonas lundensis]
MLSLLKNEDLKGANATQVLNGVTKDRASFYQVFKNKALREVRNFAGYFLNKNL